MTLATQTTRLARLTFGGRAALDLVEAIIDQHGMAAADAAIEAQAEAQFAPRYTPADPLPTAWDRVEAEAVKWTEGWREWTGPVRATEFATEKSEVV